MNNNKEDNLEQEFKKAINPNEEFGYIKKIKITFGKKNKQPQPIIRIPLKVIKELKLKEGDYFIFKLKYLGDEKNKEVKLFCDIEK